MEEYVDNTLVKRMQWKAYLSDLGPILDHMEQFNLRLNPKKCRFGVTFGKLLGYIISVKGIKVEPEKVQAIMEMSSPRNISQMRGLQG